MKIEKTDRFSVERGTGAELEKTIRIFKDNGVIMHGGLNPMDTNWVGFHYPYSDNRVDLFFASKLHLPTHYTPAEFHAKYGNKFEYPFDLVGDAIEHLGKYLRAVDPSKPMILDGKIDMYLSDYKGSIKFAESPIVAIINATLPFAVAAGNCWGKAWVEVDAPEPQRETITLEEAEKRFGIKIKVEVVK